MKTFLQKKYIHTILFSSKCQCIGNSSFLALRQIMGWKCIFNIHGGNFSKISLVGT